jgi:FKBP-type peptidyl-prolyl cis-trans isomerase FklB
MKKILILLFVVLFGVCTMQAQTRKGTEKDKPSKTAALKLKTRIDTISYIIGGQIGSNFKRNDLEITIDKFIDGIKAGMKGVDTVFTKAEVDTIMKRFQEEMMAKMQAEKGKKAGDNKSKGAAFLEENKKKPGVTVLPSGLQYKVITQGTGNHPLAIDTVTVNYNGTLIDGTTFDSTKDGKPATFPLNRVIPGWTEGLQLMQPGAKYMFYIPSELGYGDREAGPIPPGSVLIFEVDLLFINGKP